MIPDKLWKQIERWLNRRPHSEKEIELYLKLRVKKWAYKKYKELLGGLSHDEVYDKIVAHIQEKGYINDQKFAAWWTEQRVEFKRFGSIRIRAELMRKGVGNDIINKAVAELVAPVEDDLVGEWKEKIEINHPDWDKQKIIKFLSSKGFSYDKIF